MHARCVPCEVKVYINVKFIAEQGMKAQRGSKDVTLLFL
jgi:hypothetical protein